MLKSEYDLLKEDEGSLSFEGCDGVGDSASRASAPPSPRSSSSSIARRSVSQSISRDARVPRMYDRSMEVTSVFRIGRASSFLRIKVWR